MAYHLKFFEPVVLTSGCPCNLLPVSIRSLVTLKIYISMKALVTLLLLLCLESMNGQADFSDANIAKILCDNEAVILQNLSNAGLDIAENTDLPCLNQSFPETNVAWLKWQIAQDGALGFTILPLDQADDIDFILYKLNGDWDDVSNKTVVRCMASGESFGEEKVDSLSFNCTGATGLRSLDIDDNEKPGCQQDANNFLAEVQAHKGETYLLFINNYHSAQGVAIEFTGNTSFSREQAPCAVAVTDENEQGLDNLPASGLKIGPLYPNPAQSEVTTSISSDHPMEAYVHIINVQGKTLKTIPFTIETGASSYSFPVADLDRGVYFLKFRIGEFLKVQRFTRM